MPYSLREFLQRYRRDQQGVISVMAAGALVLALAVAMIVIDTGSMLYARRDLQAATDAAALGAVRQIATAQAAAETIIAMNIESETDVDIVAGEYVANPSLNPLARFNPSADEADFNAVRVTTRTDSPTYFARLFGFENLTKISTTATAAYLKTVSFSAGTRVAELNGGLANQILGGLLGTNVNLSLIDYNALASASINALSFLDALATQVGLEAGSHTYGDLLNTNVTVGDLVAAAVDVLTGDTFEGNPAVARVALESILLPAANQSLQLDQLLNATPFSDRTIGSIGEMRGDPLVFNLFDLVSGTASVLGEGETVAFSTALAESLASVSGTVTVGEPMAHMAVGKVGDFVRTSQVEVQLTATVDTGISSLVNAVIEVPVYINAAEGTATAVGIPCMPDSTMAVLSGATGAVSARYGTSTDSSPQLATLQIGAIPVADLYLSGAYSLASGGPADVSFIQSDIDGMTVKSTSSDVAILSGLGGALEIEPVLLGTSLPGLDALLSGVTSTLTSVASGVSASLDPVVDGLLTTLGVRLGSMDMIVHGTRCNTPVLVL
jgi:uncharacterized membrane protein